MSGRYATWQGLSQKLFAEYTCRILCFLASGDLLVLLSQLLLQLSDACTMSMTASSQVN